MNVLSVFITVALGGALQAVVPTFAALGQVRAPVLLALVVYYALTRSRPAVLGIAVLAGVVQDALGMIPLGYSSFCFCIAGLLVNQYREEVFFWEGVTHMIFGGVAALGVTLALYGLMRATGVLDLPATRVLLKAFGALVLGLIATPLVYHAVERLDLMLGNRRKERA